MSLKEDELKTSSVSFSDQITSRLHRWVQRTTRKVRNEKERSHNVGIHDREKENMKETGMDIKKCTQRENVARNSRESRSYDELEKALKDLINNCVTNNSAVQESCSVETHENTNIDVTKENNNNTEYGATNKTNAGVNGHFQVESDTEAEIAVASWPGSLQENDYNSSETTLGPLPQRGESKQNDVGENLIEREGRISPMKDEMIEENPGSSRHDERRSEHGTKFSNGLNHSSKSPETCAVNTPLSSVHKGLSTAGYIKQHHWDTPSSQIKGSPSQTDQESKKRLKQKPPLRRIQSEGDALELRLSFNDNDVTEFAATCIRHAQKKRFSDITPMLRKADFHFGSLGEKNDCLKSLVTKDDGLAANDKEGIDVLNHEQVIPEISLNQTDSRNATQEHIPLSDRQSLSLPLEPPRSITISGKSKNSPSSFPRSTPSPKFRKFPCQPVFYVPKPPETRTVPKKTRSGSVSSVGEQSKVEYLI